MCLRFHRRFCSRETKSELHSSCLPPVPMNNGIWTFGGRMVTATIAFGKARGRVNVRPGNDLVSWLNNSEFVAIVRAHNSHFSRLRTFRRIGIPANQFAIAVHPKVYPQFVIIIRALTECHSILHIASGGSQILAAENTIHFNSPGQKENRKRESPRSMRRERHCPESP